MDKRYGRELVEQGKAFRLAIFEGNPSNEWPAWEVLKEVVDKTPRAVTDNVSVSVGEEGSVRASLKVERTYGDSKFTQYITTVRRTTASTSVRRWTGTAAIRCSKPSSRCR